MWQPCRRSGTTPHDVGETSNGLTSSPSSSVSDWLISSRFPWPSDGLISSHRSTRHRWGGRRLASFTAIECKIEWVVCRIRRRRTGLSRARPCLLTIWHHRTRYYNVFATFFFVGRAGVFPVFIDRGVDVYALCVGVGRVAVLADGLVRIGTPPPSGGCRAIN